MLFLFFLILQSHGFFFCRFFIPLHVKRHDRILQCALFNWGYNTIRHCYHFKKNILRKSFIPRLYIDKQRWLYHRLEGIFRFYWKLIAVLHSYFIQCECYRVWFFFIFRPMNWWFFDSWTINFKKNTIIDDDYVNIICVFFFLEKCES